MENILFYAAGAATIAALITHLLVPAVTRLAVALRALDPPGGRKLQAQAVPRLGGVAIGLGLALSAGVVAVIRWENWGTAILRSDLLALGLGTALVFLVGVADDLVGVSTAKKFLVQVVAAFLLVRIGWSFEVLRLPGLGVVELGLFGGVVSLLWIVGVTNAINLLDGLDGLAGGVVAIISSSMLCYAIVQRNPGTVILMAATAGACLGFLRHNWEPARVFMGDSGSLTLGFLLAAASVHSSLKAPAAVAILVPILALGVPVIDTLLVMLVRFLNRPKGPLTTRFLGMFHADRNHLHHLLEHLGARRTKIVGMIYAVVLSFCALALIVAVTGETALGVVLLVMEFAVVLGMRQMGMVLRARRLARQQREEIKTGVMGLPEEPRPIARVSNFVRR